MNVIHPRVEVLNVLGNRPALEHLEVCGRTAYKSEERIGPGTAAKFVASLLQRGHLSVLEHHQMVFCLHRDEHDTADEDGQFLDALSTISLLQDETGGVSVVERAHEFWLGVNVRTLVEAARVLPDENLVQRVLVLASQNLPDIFGHGGSSFDANDRSRGWRGTLRLVPQDKITALPMSKAARLTTVSLRFVCDRGVSHELVRHRKMSITQESTRYVNYGKKGCTFVIPPWEPYTPTTYDNNANWVGKTAWWQSMKHAEDYYTNMVGPGGFTPQQARSVLPNSTKTEVCMTGTLHRWHQFFTLRVADGVHPQMAQVAVPALRWFQAQPTWGAYFADITPGAKWGDLRLAQVVDLEGEL